MTTSTIQSIRAESAKRRFRWRDRLAACVDKIVEAITPGSGPKEPEPMQLYTFTCQGHPMDLEQVCILGRDDTNMGAEGLINTRNSDEARDALADVVVIQNAYGTTTSCMRDQLFPIGVK